MEDYITELCERADYYGMESLTEEELYILSYRGEELYEA